MVSQVYAYVQTLQIVRIKYVQFFCIYKNKKQNKSKHPSTNISKHIPFATVEFILIF